MKHFSATVQPGARRIAVSGGPFKDVVAFQNPDGSKVLAFANGGDQTTSATVQVGETACQLDVPPKSINTVILH
jgi:O-glycosyl hydrolase